MHRLAISFAIACTLTFGLDQWLHHQIESSGQAENTLTQGLFGVAAIYHRLVTSSPRKPVPRYTALVTLSASASPPGLSVFNTCQERGFLGSVLTTLSRSHPTVVVIDKYFGKDTCPAADPGTAALVDGVRALCESHVKVVVGRAVNSEARSQAGVSRSYPLDPALSFGQNGTCVSEGVLNIDLDLRRVDLWWPNVQPVNGIQGAPPSLALAAALAASPDLLANGRLAGWSAGSPPPYVSFLKENQFRRYNLQARSLVCGTQGRACTYDELSPAVRELAHRPVIVIGEDIPELDRHDTVIGDIPGYMLQANYIESLLDDRVIRPVAEGWNLVTGLVVFVGFEYILWRFHRAPLAAVWRLIVLFGGVSLVIYLSVVLLGYYLNPAAVSIIAVLLRVADLALGTLPGSYERAPT